MQATKVPIFSHWPTSLLKHIINDYTLNNGAKIIPKILSTFAVIENLS